MLLNSDDRFRGHDHFDDPAQLHDFLADHGILARGETVSSAGAGRLRAFRDAVRAFVAEPDASTIAELNELATSHPIVVRIEGGGDASWLVSHEPRDTADRIIACQLRTLHHAIDDGRWIRLNICGREDCQWVYYDSSRNRSARWCSADPCGDVMKSRAWRERQKVSVD